MNGTLYVDSSYSGNNYSGGWLMTGNVSLLAGTAGDDLYAYTGDVSFRFNYYTRYDYTGTITADGTSWSISSY